MIVASTRNQFASYLIRILYPKDKFATILLCEQVVVKSRTKAS